MQTPILSMQIVAERASTSRKTLKRIEDGDMVSESGSMRLSCMPLAYLMDLAMWLICRMMNWEKNWPGE